MPFPLTQRIPKRITINYFFDKSKTKKLNSKRGCIIGVLFGKVAEWLCSGLQSRGRRFDSDPCLDF